MSINNFLAGVGDVEPAYFNRRGAFHSGATISSKKDVVYSDKDHGGNGSWWQYTGTATLPMNVPKGSSPGTNWVDVGAASVYDLVRVQLANLDAALQKVTQLNTAVTNLGTSKQDADATLAALAGLVTAADKLAYFTDVDKLATTSLTAFARTLLAGAAAADMRTTLGLGSAALKTIGLAAGNVPDMSAFATGGTNGVYTFINIAGQKRLMEGTGQATFNNGTADFTLPMAFASAGYTAVLIDPGAIVMSYSGSPVSASVLRIYAKDAAGTIPANGSILGFKYIMLGSA